MSRGHLIIDGYNVLHVHPVYAGLIDVDLDAVRARFVSDLAGYAHGGPRTIVVFDGAGNPASDGTPHHLGALTVIFSASGTSADTVIEGLARRFRDRGDPTVVVTSDAATRDTVGSGTVSVTSSAQFVTELMSERLDRAEAATGDVRRVPVSQRIDSGVGEALARWARGVGPVHVRDVKES